MVFLMKTILFFLFLFLRRFFSFHKEKKAAKEKSLPQEALLLLTLLRLLGGQGGVHQGLEGGHVGDSEVTPASLRPLMRLE